MGSRPPAFPIEIACKGILFDMDGILISSIEAVERAWLHWAAMRGVDRDLTLATLHGRRAIETVALLRPDLDSETEFKLVEDLESADTEDLKVLPGVVDLLRALPSDRWTVVTSATMRLTRMRLAAARLPIPERMVTAECVRNGKPHPEPFLVGAELLRRRPEECVVFEDSVSGVRAGRAAGCTVVATIFSHDEASLDAAHYVIRDFTQLTVQSSEEGLVLRLG